MMGATHGAGTAYPSGPPEFNQVFSGVRIARFLVFYVVFCRSLFVLLVIVLSVLFRFTASDYPFGIFQLQCTMCHAENNKIKFPEFLNLL
jgi:hypothetical protein